MKKQTSWIENYYFRYVLFMVVLMFFGLLGSIESVLIVVFGLIFVEINYRFGKLEEQYTK